MLVIGMWKVAYFPNTPKPRVAYDKLIRSSKIKKLCSHNGTTLEFRFQIIRRNFPEESSILPAMCTTVLV